MAQELIGRIHDRTHLLFAQIPVPEFTNEFVKKEGKGKKVQMHLPHAMDTASSIFCITGPQAALRAQCGWHAVRMP